jgi:RimJ/RimL family protein N-acetyltransferase
MPRPFTLHSPSEDDWQSIRDLRIRAVTDTPIAFLETLEHAVEADETDWRQRARRNVDDDSTQIVAIDPDGRWIGSMICFINEGSPPYVAARQPGPRRANLVGVFVDPEWRGDAGVTDALLGEIGRWVTDEKGLQQLYLHVSADNPRARRSYEKRGFVTTGVVDRIPDRPDDREIEMVAPLPLRSTL